MTRLDQVLKHVGAVLVRDKKHKVYLLPNGQKFTVSQTPSDARAEDNAISDLRALVGRAAMPQRQKATADARASRRLKPGRHDAPVRQLRADLREALIAKKQAETERKSLEHLLEFERSEAAAAMAHTQKGWLQTRQELAALKQWWPVRVALWLAGLWRRTK